MNPIYLPKLNYLTPTFDSTLLKAVEEAGELARAVLQFLPYDESNFDKKALSAQGKSLLLAVSQELLDVAQTCVTMIFVMEDEYHVDADQLIRSHLAKLTVKGYQFDERPVYQITTVGCFKSLHLPRLYLENVTLLTTVCKIQEELGELTQYVGKKSGASGESHFLEESAVLAGCAAELLDVAQCCFTMMYILAEQYHVNIAEVVAEHVQKLERKGYFGS
ncbi:NTP pyrophosphatase (non-canonical NTP hydrolase) [Sporomusaceae bacterium BoRhaA]|uniref:nucleotide pyrophosphohydrolase n=1 Tax=Pelorhabdus rhamnosifermentans TaxID=2772457 RepID=UPI001C06089C|nr:nucleotide pyrophosphohydrolase [Pelorhabdus rhamnosifermentans]MBU2698925.1 NTP pyrophosphatase (non-canonical NTP hydrolase) [Pelorhabdus rhamnosifermentans]